MAINNNYPGLSDGKLELSDSNWTMQYNIGILIEPWKKTRFGLTYLSKADLDFSPIGPRSRISVRG